MERLVSTEDYSNPPYEEHPNRKENIHLRDLAMASTRVMAVISCGFERLFFLFPHHHCGWIFLVRAMSRRSFKSMLSRGGSIVKNTASNEARSPANKMNARSSKPRAGSDGDARMCVLTEKND